MNEWFKLVDIDKLDKFSLKIVNHKSRLQFFTIKARKVFYVVASFLLGIFIVFHLLIQNGPWSFAFLADIFESKVRCLTIDILCRCSAYLWICSNQAFSLSTTTIHLSPCYTRPYSKYSCELQANKLEYFVQCNKGHIRN